MDFKLMFVAIVVTLACLSSEVTCAVSGYSGWNAAPNTQYHIQTDEGDERYFRFQTTSGQYRKEKRLEDGTVIGTSGWVDPNGMLRLSDYIADNKGYRILRSKMIYVGNEDIGKSIAKAKKVPAQSGTLVTQNLQAPTTLLKTVETSTPAPTYSPSILPALSSGGYPSTTPTYAVPESESTYAYPTPEVNTNAIGVVYPEQKAALESEGGYTPFANPYVNNQNRPAYPIRDRTYPAPTQIYQNPYRPPYMAYENFGKKTSFVNNYDHPSSSNVYNQKFDAIYNQNAIRAGARNPQGYTQNLPSYDGISTTKDGFRYYLPRQYHEEVSSPSGESRTGSFGYIDPFGIRRVTYYNTDPGTGFVHRKNNRYVGFNAAPYDPRF